MPPPIKQEGAVDSPAFFQKLRESGKGVHSVFGPLRGREDYEMKRKLMIMALAAVLALQNGIFAAAEEPNEIIVVEKETTPPESSAGTEKSTETENNTGTKNNAEEGSSAEVENSVEEGSSAETEDGVKTEVLDGNGGTEGTQEEPEYSEHEQVTGCEEETSEYGKAPEYGEGTGTEEQDGMISSVEVVEGDDFGVKPAEEGESPAAVGVAINETNFPDPVFRAYVKEEFDTGCYVWNEKGEQEWISYRDGVLVAGEINKITHISVVESNISSLKGIEFFQALTSLYCGNNNLSSLDVSHNAALQSLSCGGNNLSSLDVSHNEALQVLGCNGNNLSSLDVSHNAALQELFCYGNDLSSLDVSHNAALQELICYENNLSSLDVSHNAKLQELLCRENNLNSLDVSHNAALQRLECYKNNLSSLDVNHNIALQYLWCYGNNLSNLDVSHNVVLQDLGCNGNNLSSLDVSRNIELRYLNCYENNLSSLDVSHNVVLQTLVCGRNNLSSLDINHNAALQTLECTGNNLGDLNVRHNTVLQTLECWDNDLSSLDVSHNAILVSLRCNGNKLGSLDLSRNTALEEVTSSASVEGEVVSKNGKCLFDLSGIVPDPSRVTLKAPVPEGVTKSGNCLEMKEDVKFPLEVVYEYKTGNTAFPVHEVHLSLSGKSDNTITASDITKTWSKKKQTFPAGATQTGDAELKYSSDNNFIKVDRDGMITVKAKYIGEATITIKAGATAQYRGAEKKIKVTVNPTPTELVEVKKSTGISLKATWKKNACGTGYELQYATDAGFGGAKTVSVLGRQTSRKQITGLKNGKTYYVRVRVYKKSSTGKTYYSEWSGAKQVKIDAGSVPDGSGGDREVRTVNELTAVDITKEYSEKEQSFSLGVKQTGDAKLTYSSDNKAIKVDGKGTVTIKAGYMGKAVIRVRAEKTAKYRKAEKKVTVTVNPGTTELEKVKQEKGLDVSVSWGKVKCATGYELQYSTNRGFGKNIIDTKTERIKNKDTTKTVITRLKNKETYYIRIRAYSEISKNEVYYSKWSKTQKIQVKYS